MLILTAFVLSFPGLVSADPAAKGWFPENFLQKMIHGHRILTQKGTPFLSSPPMAGFGNNFYGNPPFMTKEDRDFSAEPQAAQSTPTPSSADHQEKEFPLLEKGRLWKEKSSYDIGRIPLLWRKPDPFLNIIPCLSVAKSKDENSLLTPNLEGMKESDILKSLAILLELKLSF
jgi:hypothetical protein